MEVVELHYSIVDVRAAADILLLGMCGLGVLVIGALLVGFSRRPRLGWSLVAIGTLSIAGGIALALYRAWLYLGGVTG